MVERFPAEPVMRKRHGLFQGIINLLSSVWFGIVLMVLIFLYMTVASAGLVYPTGPNLLASDNWAYMLPRKHPWIDKTEMEIFSWWPFTTLIALFVINMAVVTVRRIRLNLLNLGVWMIHTGIVILALGSVYYFGSKLEGDAPVFRRHIVLDVPGAAEPQRLIVRPGAQASVRGEDGLYSFRIQDINPAWPLLSGDDAGKTACSVNVSVTTPTRSFIRQMLMDYPEYTEDIIPGQGRAVKIVNEKLLDKDLDLRFEYEPQTWFYLMDSAALYVREVGQKHWIERPIRGLPHYSDHIASRSEIWQPEGEKPIEPNPLDIAVPAVDPEDPLGSMDVRVTGRLHYAPQIEQRWANGGDRFNPVLSMRIEQGDDAQDVSLQALNPQANTLGGGLMEFQWASEDDAFDSIASRVGSRLRIEVPESGASATIVVDETNTLARNERLEYAPIEGTDWSYRVRGVDRNLRVDENNTIALAIVEFKSGDKYIRRWISDVPGRTRDVLGEHELTEPDPEIVATYQPGPMISLIAGPGSSSVHAIVNTPDNRIHMDPGKPYTIGPGLTLTVLGIFPNAYRDTRLVVPPRNLRDPKAGAHFSRIKLELHQGNWSQTHWLEYHRYPLPDEQYAVPRRFAYNPTVIALPDGRTVEMMFSRRRWPLPAAVALENFELKTHVGGFVPGATTSVRDFVSVLRSYRNGQWSDTFTCSLNKPAEDGGMYYFQSEWDPGEMAFTGLGVGNRKGVYIQLFGTCVSVAGMIWVFYIKPIIKRRRREAVWASMETQDQEQIRESEPAVV